MMFVTDLDKTFLRSDLTISGFSKKTWNSLKHPATVATARSLRGTLSLLKGLRLNYPLILLDGAMIATSEGEVLKITAIEKELADVIVKSVYKNFSDYPLIVGFNEINNEKFLYPKVPNPYQLHLLRSYKNDSRVFSTDTVEGMKYNLKMVYLGEKKFLQQIESFLLKYFDVEVKLTKDAYGDYYFLTVLNPSADKAHALAFVEEYTDTDRKDVTVFGDNLNDIGMFERAGVSVAVKNAVEEVKKRADIVLAYTNDEDAVAKYLAKTEHKESK